MNTELSLESIKQCLEIEKKKLECIEILLNVHTENFLKKEIEDKSNDLQKLEAEKVSIEEFLKTLISQDEAQTNVDKASADVQVQKMTCETAANTVKAAEETYKEAEKAYNSAEEIYKKVYEAHGEYVNNVNKETAEIQRQIDERNGRCKCVKALRDQKQSQEQKITAANNDLANKLSDKTTADAAKTTAETEKIIADTARTTEDQALKESKEVEEKAQEALQTIKDNQQKIEIYDKQWGSTKNDFGAAHKMLETLHSQVKEIESNDQESTRGIHEENSQENEMDMTIVNNPIQEQEYEL